MAVAPEHAAGARMPTHRLAVLRFWVGVLAVFLVTVAAGLVTIALVPIVLSSWTATVVGSGSMQPTLHPGDVVVLEPVERGQVLQPPSVVLLDDPTRELPVLHRIVRHEPGRGYVTKGDANPEPDSNVAPVDSVRGAGRLVVPLVGWPLLWLSERDLPRLAAFLVLTMVLLRLARYGWLDRYDPWRGQSGGDGRAPVRPTGSGAHPPARQPQQPCYPCW